MGSKARRRLKHKMRCQAKALRIQSGHGNRTFTVFGKLPPELQLRIWKFAAEKHGLLEVHAETRGKKHGSKEIVFTTLSRLPWGVMMACKASRDIALKSLPYSLPVPNGNVPIRFSQNNTIYINNYRHFIGIVLTHYNKSRKRLDSWAEHITTMIVGYNALEPFHGFETNLSGRTFTLFPNLHGLAFLFYPRGTAIALGEKRLFLVTARDKNGKVGQLNSKIVKNVDIGNDLSDETQVRAVLGSVIREVNTALTGYVYEDLTTWKTGWKVPAVAVLCLGK